ncbi:MAG: alpha/beta hydrolase [Bacteroidota bacterium]
MIIVHHFSRVLRWRSLYFSIALLGGLTLFYSAGEMRISDRAYEFKLRKNSFQYEASIHYQETKERTLRYLEIGADHLPLIVFIHGAPSSSAFWKNMLRDSSLLANAKLLAVDRPGYGYSGYGKPEISVKKQAAMIAQILKKKRAQHERIVVHGSSYGGTVAARLAMDFPELVDGLLLQSASVKSGAERTYPISYPTHHWSLRWAVPGSLRTANAEKLSHHLALDKMRDGWKNIRAATIVLHGEADGLIYPDNAFFSFDQITNAVYRDIRFFADRKHDLLWTKTEVLTSSLLKLVHFPG